MSIESLVAACHAATAKRKAAHEFAQDVALVADAASERDRDALRAEEDAFKALIAFVRNQAE